MKRYAIVGTGSRSWMYTQAILTEFRDRAALVGMCDVNQTRMAVFKRAFQERLGVSATIPTYPAHEFDRMVAEQRPDTIIVTSIDRTHHRYIIRAMQLGCDVITEKPMTIDAPRCQAILDAQRETGRDMIVTFNYRYAPRNSKIKELILNGAIGRVLSVHFEWLLDTRHGADYFRRWHRDKRNSGGLMVHKATHHFDLVNWWIDSAPETVFGFGKLAFYGRENAEERGETVFYDRVHGSAAAKGDPWGLDLEADPDLRALYLETEHEDGYIRDRSVFSDMISIEDDMAVLVRYASGATMSYHLTAYSPWEGYRVMFNGTRGRLEFSVEENSYVSGAQDDFNRPELRDAEPIGRREEPEIVLRPLWGKPVRIPLEEELGGHGGGDARLLRDVFGERIPDPLGRMAGSRAGALSILTGIAANRSFDTGAPVCVSDLVKL